MGPMTAPGTKPQCDLLMSMDYRILRIILGGVLLLVAAFALGTRLAEWDQEQVQPEPPPAEMEDGKKPS
jgi:hypothetical protein